MLEDFFTSTSTKRSLIDGIQHSNKAMRLISGAPPGTQFDFDRMLPFYGKVDHNLNPVQMSKEYASAIGTNNFGQEIQVLDFVAEAYRGFKRYIKKGTAYNKIAKSSIFSNVDPVSGHIDLDMSYREYMADIFSVFYGSYIIDREKEADIVDFISFLSVFMEFFYSIMSKNKFALTKSGYYLYVPNSILHTGLAIKVSDVSMEDMSSDTGYGYYCSGARKFGFLVNASDPSIIVANVENGGVKTTEPFSYQPQFGQKDVIVGMERFLTEIGSSRDTVFSDRFFSIIHDQANEVLSDFNLLKSYLLQFYENISIDVPAISTSVPCNVQGRVRTKQKITFRQKFKYDRNDDFPSDFTRQFPDSFWLDIYLRIKIIETSRPIQYKKVLKQALSYYRKNGLRTALFYINYETKIIPQVQDGTYIAQAYALSTLFPTSRMTTTNLVPTGGSTGGGMSGY